MNLYSVFLSIKKKRIKCDASVILNFFLQLHEPFYITRSKNIFETLHLVFRQRNILIPVLELDPTIINENNC